MIKSATDRHERSGADLSVKAVIGSTGKNHFFHLATGNRFSSLHNKDAPIRTYRGYEPAQVKVGERPGGFWF